MRQGVLVQNKIRHPNIPLDMCSLLITVFRLLVSPKKYAELKGSN